MFPEQSAGTCAVIARPVYRAYRASLLLSMIKIKLYQISLSLGCGRCGYEISICYPKGAHYPSNNALESDRQRFTSESKHLSTRNGILVGKLIPSFLPGTSQMNSICEHIRAIQGTYHGSISEVAEECRSIFFLLTQPKVAESYSDLVNMLFTLCFQKKRKEEKKRF